MKLGEVLKKEREKTGLSHEQVAEKLSISMEEYLEIENGESPIEKYGLMLQNFAKVIEQPVSNIFYPCGLPFQELDDYP